MGAGCKVFGGIEVGDDAAIGANCVFTKSVPPMGVMDSVPGKVVFIKVPEHMYSIGFNKEFMAPFYITFLYEYFPTAFLLSENLSFIL